MWSLPVHLYWNKYNNYDYNVDNDSPKCNLPKNNNCSHSDRGMAHHKQKCRFDAGPSTNYNTTIANATKQQRS